MDLTLQDALDYVEIHGFGVCVDIDEMILDAARKVAEQHARVDGGLRQEGS
jgi:hypothetical protein